MSSYRIIPRSADNVKRGFWFPRELAEYIDNFNQPEKKYAALVYAVRYGLRIGGGVPELSEMEKIIRNGQLALYRGDTNDEDEGEEDDT